MSAPPSRTGPRDARVPPQGEPSQRAGRRAETVGNAVGIAAIVVGGLVAAVTGPLQLAKGSWLAAYLVLICGVGQCLLARQDRLLGPSSAATRSGAGRRSTWITTLWISGNALVISGALSALPLIADLGGAALGAALVLALIGTRGSPATTRAWLLRACFLALIISIPVGLVLTHLRAAG